MSILSILGFGSGKIKEALRKGAAVIDVRTAQEYDLGRVPGSINIPLDRVSANAQRIMQMNCPIIFCCASGARSAEAARMMKEKGLKNVLNGGSWVRVLRIKKTL